MEVLPTETARPLAYSTYLSVPLSTVPTYVREYSTLVQQVTPTKKDIPTIKPMFSMDAFPASRPFSSNERFLVPLHTFAMRRALWCPCTQTSLHDLPLTSALQSSFLPQSFRDIFPPEAPSLFSSSPCQWRPCQRLDSLIMFYPPVYPTSYPILFHLGSASVLGKEFW